MRYNLFILGSPNSVDGVLSATSMNRISKAIELQKRHPEIVILATGGFGSHFNTSAVPHRELLYRYLHQQGASIDRASPNDMLSSNTVEDITMIVRFLTSASRGRERCGIVTSKFHMARCRYIFECLAVTNSVDFFEASDPSSLDPATSRHETIALAQLQAQGGILVGDVLSPHPQPSARPVSHVSPIQQSPNDIEEA
jgi:hypothetical protein